ncbi:MAG: SMP-30/gluconolactonase/LRE family protein [Nitrospinota bacterium]
MLARQLPTHRRISSIGPVLAAATALVLLVGGCATERPQFTELLWPPPPLTSRIKFVGILQSQDDLGRSSGELFVEALVGGKRAPESLQMPMAVAPSRDGKRLYVSDFAKGVVFVFDFEARRLGFLGGPTLGFKRPFGVAVDEADNVYAVDSELKLIRVFDPKGKFLREITHKSLERPTGIAIDPRRRRIYVADSSSRTSENHVIHVFDMDGAHLKAFGGRGREEGKFYFPTYLAVDKSGNIYVADTLNARVQVFDPEGRYVKAFGQRGDSIGMFDKPKGVALDSFGNLYVVDSSWSNVQIFNQRKQILLYFAGWGRIPGLLFNPTGIAIDKENRIYVVDCFNARVAIYQLINTKGEDSFLSPPLRADRGGDPEKEKAKKGRLEAHKQ